MRITKTPILWSAGGFAVLFFGVFFSFDALAYTATLSTSGQVKIDVSTAANSAAVGVDNVVVSSTCPFGYDLSIGGTNDNALYKSGDNTSSYLISSTAGTTANPRPIIGDDGGGNSYLGTWGYTTTSNATFSSHFVGLTSSTTLLANKTSASAVGGDIIPVYYGASVNHSIEPGLYKMSNNNAVTYYLTANPSCFVYKIQYNDNNANSLTTMGITHNNVHEDDEVTLAASNYKRTGYGFAGWSTVQLNPGSATFQSDLATAKAAGQVFGPNETITANASFISHATVVNSEQIITLYAIWVPSAGNIQNWTGCSSMTTGQVTALTDQRDNDTYAVAKLADGNCWMIENLRLDYDASQNTSGTLAQGYSGVFAGLAQPETANFINSTTANSLYYSGTQSGTATIDIGATDYPEYRFPRYRNDNTNSNSTINPNTTVNSMSGTNQNIYSYGDYYTWAAAIANTSYHETDNQSATTTSLCPAGWRLPKGGNKNRIISDDDNEFWNLIVDELNNGTLPANYDSSTYPYYDGSAEGTPVSKLVRTYPNNFLYSGNAEGSMVYSRGSYGYYWSSTERYINNSYHLCLGNLRVDPGTRFWDKSEGYSIRCLASTEYTISYNANGGTGTMNDQKVEVGDIVNLNPNSFTRTNYIFAGWNTAANGSGTSYADEQSVSNLATAGGTITLYAQWKQLLYDKVASMTKGTQTAANLQTTISSSNSGVYTYNSSAFGAATDASSDYNIYYYRGILDNTTGTYGSNGDAGAYPNYVRLDNNTCWRIVRTTGSGGIKMIYNGVWGSNTCAKATTAAQISSPVSTSTFNGTASTASIARQVVRVGYTHNSTYASTSTTTGVTFTTVMGSNTNYSVNNTNSTIKGNVESWYNSNMTDYTSMLEPNAGYCNDRYSYTTATGSTATSSIRPYTTSTNTGATYVAYFAGHQRNAQTTRTPSLGCPSTRNIVDIYSTDTSAGGNGQLSYPVGLLTADEASFAGSGSSTASQGSSYNANSFLRTGSNFWTMTPSYRSSGYAYNFYLATGGALTNNGRIDTAYGIRPVISLKHGATIGGGDGTATSPWTLGKYTISYNANGGSGTMSNQTVYSGLEISLSANSFTAPSGKGFVGWNTNADGSGVAYAPGQTVTDLTTSGSSITLYAQWGDPTLYDLVAAMSKGTQTAADLQAVITKPTSSNPTTDTSNSGVYEYNSSVFGTASDASNTYPIYYYRGILDSNLDDTSSSSYGSNGDGAYYPNYVRLGNTCWRIVRTTGSGGVKMIYNGLYSSGTTANSCANANSNAGIAIRAFGSQGASAQSTWYNNISRVGYTYNAAVDDSTTTTSVDTVFGSNSNYTTTNTTDSNIKDYLENTWFTSSNGISAYESILEPSAGYCNDRTAFSNEAGSTALTTIPPYATSSATMYFGSYSRNRYAGGKPSLTCPSSRNIVDLYTTASATNGNKQLAKPVALLTADEAALSGSGSGGRTAATTYSSNYSYSSFLRSGSGFFFLSPSDRDSRGDAYEFALRSDGYLVNRSVDITYEVRPAISLKYGTTPVSGTGTATDPWIIAP